MRKKFFLSPLHLYYCWRIFKHSKQDPSSNRTWNVDESVQHTAVWIKKYAAGLELLYVLSPHNSHMPLFISSLIVVVTAYIHYNVQFHTNAQHYIWLVLINTHGKLIPAPLTTHKVLRSDSLLQWPVASGHLTYWPAL